MSLKDSVFSVIAACSVFDVDSGETLLPADHQNFDVHPPSWSVNNFQMLYSNLQNLAAMQFLKLLRVRLSDTKHPYSTMKLENRQYAIRCEVLGWVTPTDANGDRQPVVFKHLMAL